jgi:hypothetical protein
MPFRVRKNKPWTTKKLSGDVGFGKGTRPIYPSRWVTKSPVSMGMSKLSPPGLPNAGEEKVAPSVVLSQTRLS